MHNLEWKTKATKENMGANIFKKMQCTHVERSEGTARRKCFNTKCFVDSVSDSNQNVSHTFMLIWRFPMFTALPFNTIKSAGYLTLCHKLLASMLKLSNFSLSLDFCFKTFWLLLIHSKKFFLHWSLKLN